MLILLSPAKNLDYKQTAPIEEFTIPENLDLSEKILNKLKKLSKKQIGELMKINPKLAETNFYRYQAWNKDFNIENAKQAIFAFNGDVYRGLDARSLSEDTIKYAQKHLIILSGLHGYLKPLDLVRPYRLEMGTKLKVGRREDLYSYWSELVTKKVKERKDDFIINLASKEYAGVIDFSKIKSRIIVPVFKEYRNGKLGTFNVLLKRARGLMTKFVLENRIEDIEMLKTFNLENYEYSDEMSSENEFVFIR
jgi:cytoplasmic iron level regulating protein YaaA (DUF328/UPF0246 family)